MADGIIFYCDLQVLGKKKPKIRHVVGNLQKWHFFLRLVREPPTCNRVTEGQYSTRLNRGFTNRVPQGSVQIELIFRLLLKITVHWPFNAINQCL